MSEPEPDFPTPEVSVEAIEPDVLKEIIEEDEDVSMLDVRVESKFEKWHIDGESVEIHNIPYFEFFADVDEHLLERVPEGDPLVVICAKGAASEYVAGLLKEEDGRDAVNLADGMNGWAEIYEAAEVSRYDGPGTLFQYHRPSTGCLGYLLIDGDEAAVIDPLRAFTDRYGADAEAHGADLKYAIDSHIHADHISGVRALDDDGVEGVLPEETTDRDVTYDDELTLAGNGDTFAVGDATIEAIHTPGHTTGMTSYLVDDSVLLTGDGLFVESVARPDLEKGDASAPEAARQLYKTLEERILVLDDDVLIGGGHVSDAAETAMDGTFTATIGELEEEMAALSMEEAAFVDLILTDMPPQPANYEDIIATNLGQQSVDDEEAFELELGPNNCAASQNSLAE